MDCPTITKLLKEAESEFKNVKGDRGAPEDAVWKSKFSVPGMTDCEVEDDELFLSFFCKAGKPSSSEEAIRSVEKLAQEIRACLEGADEESSGYRERSRSGLIFRTYKKTEFSFPKSGLSVSISARGLEREENKEKSYSVDFEVALDKDPV